MYYEGQGIKQDSKEALKWFQHAADPAFTCCLRRKIALTLSLNLDLSTTILHFRQYRKYLAHLAQEA
jgi:hypothetical protein